MYEKLEKLREIKARLQTKKPLQFGTPRNLGYHAIINSMPRTIPLSDLVKYHDYVREMAENRT